MEQIFAPWRIEWVKRDTEEDGCVFCRMREQGDEYLIARSEHAFVVLNNSPYNPGHVMVVPYAHTGDYSELGSEEVTDHARLKQATIDALRRSFEPDGFNTGLNLGDASGGSIDDHLHTHLVPRWGGDTNFMPVTADTKVIVQALDDSYEGLYEAFLTHEDADGTADEDDVVFFSFS